MPAGIVDKILEKIKPVMQYDRRGGLYCAEVKLSSFGRPVLKQYGHGPRLELPDP